MERIIKQGPSYKSKKLEQEYQETTIRFKKMKTKALGISVEKMLEKKKILMKEVKSNYLPLISQTTKNENDISISDLLGGGSRNGAAGRRAYNEATLTSDQMRNAGRNYMHTELSLGN
jgi:hypothetical protein